MYTVYHVTDALREEEKDEEGEEEVKAEGQRRPCRRYEKVITNNERMSE